jgi:glycosyltransferase involved in cell wall biosynthesis
MTNRPLVSIVTPSFNQGSFLEQTLLSVIGQTYRNIEYIVVDGGSTDDSVSILERYQEHLAYWHSRPDKGFADAIRQGFARAKGEILAYLNSDDLLAPDAVQKAIAALARHPDAVMVYGNRVCIDAFSRFLYLKPNLPWLEKTSYISMTIAQESCFWRRDAYRKVGGINTNLKFAIDYDLFGKLTLSGRVVHSGDIWGFFRKHSASKTMTQYRTLGKQECYAIQKALWGKRANRPKWLAVVCLMRCYALFAGTWVRYPLWPVCLPPREARSFFARVYDSLDEGSLAKRFLKFTKIGGR